MIVTTGCTAAQINLCGWLALLRPSGYKQTGANPLAVPHRYSTDETVEARTCVGTVLMLGEC